MCLAETSVRGKKWQMALFQVGSTINEMKRLFVVLAVISLTGSVTFAQKVHSDNQDIRFAAGVRMPIELSSASDETVMTLTYGRFFDNGLGFRTGAQWMFKNYEIDEYLGVPLYLAWRSGKRTFKESVRQGAENIAWGSYHNKYYYGTNPDAGTVFGQFLSGLLNRIEFFGGLTPGYIFGAKEEPHGTGSIGSTGVRTENYMTLNNRFSLTADAGFAVSFRIWRFELSAIPSVHYFITDNYREVNIRRDTHDGSTDVFTSDKARSWQFSFQGGLSFSF